MSGRPVLVFLDGGHCTIDPHRSFGPNDSGPLGIGSAAGHYWWRHRPHIMGLGPAAYWSGVTPGVYGTMVRYDSDGDVQETRTLTSWYPEDRPWPAVGGTMKSYTYPDTPTASRARLWTREPSRAEWNVGWLWGRYDDNDTARTRLPAFIAAGKIETPSRFLVVETTDEDSKPDKTSGNVWFREGEVVADELTYAAACAYIDAEYAP